MQQRTGSRREHLGQARPGFVAEDAWPGNRNPSPSDAEVAYNRLSTQALRIFSQAVLAESRVESGPPSAGALTIHSILAESSTAGGPLLWPTGLFSTTQSTVQGYVPDRLEYLVLRCCDDFLSHVPFLRELPASFFNRSPRPWYLTLAMASMGSLLSGESQTASTALWHDSVRLLTGQLEVDNSEARRLDLLKAWVLLETYGFLTADRLVSKRTSLAHGYVETAVCRGLRASADTNHAPDGVPGSILECKRSLVAYFKLVDLLRAIHFGQPATFASSEPHLWPSCNSIAPIADSELGPVNTVAFARLLSILSDVHVFKHLARALKPPSTHDTPTYRAYVPFGVGVELEQLRQRLLDELGLWSDAYLAVVAGDLVLLYRFCRMYLIAPDVQSLFASAGYDPCRRGTLGVLGSHGFQAPQLPQRRTVLAQLAPDPRQNAQSLAWLVLEASEALPAEELPFWAPLAVFSAALVVATDLGASAAVVDAQFDREQRGRANLRLLRLFQAELGRGRAPCVTEMARILTKISETLGGGS